VTAQPAAAETSISESPIVAAKVATRSLLPVSVSVHVYPDTPVRVRLYPGEDRAVLILGDAVGCPTVLDVYLARTELVALCETLTTAVADLDTAHTANPEHAARQGGPDTDGRTVTSNPVRTPAA
jgi:hypothetical protein